MALPRAFVCVQGLGPRFKLCIQLRNDGMSQLAHLPLVVLADPGTYRTTPCSRMLPLLVPGVLYTHEVDVLCLSPEAPPGAISVMVLAPQPGTSQGQGTAPSTVSSAPLLQAQVQMPLSELEDDG